MSIHKKCCHMFYVIVWTHEMDPTSLGLEEAFSDLRSVSTQMVSGSGRWGGGICFLWHLCSVLCPFLYCSTVIKIPQIIKCNILSHLYKCKLKIVVIWKNKKRLPLSEIPVFPPVRFSCKQTNYVNSQCFLPTVSACLCTLTFPNCLGLWVFVIWTLIVYGLCFCATNSVLLLCVSLPWLPWCSALSHFPPISLIICVYCQTVCRCPSCVLFPGSCVYPQLQVLTLLNCKIEQWPEQSLLSHFKVSFFSCATLY